MPRTVTPPIHFEAMITPAARRPRLESIDVIRGGVMILMALDHVRDFFGPPGSDPTNLGTTTIPEFFTRWITHFCAPTFFLLMGTGAFLYGRERTRLALSRFLLTRGLWLVLLEVTVIRCLGMQFNVDYHVTMLIVIWALGCALITLAALVWLPTWLVATFGLVLIAGHNLFDTVRTDSPWWTILHRPGLLWRDPTHVIFVSYPLIPWIGVTAAGYALGVVYTWTADRRRAFLLRVGLALSAAFVVLRATNVYGNPFPWRPQPYASFTVLSFLNTAKYPPSLLFLLMTLGPALIALALVDRATPRVLRPAITFGRVPLFYFLLHLPLIHAFATIACAIRYGGIHWMFESPDLGHYPVSSPPGWGFLLPVIYLVWIAVVVTLYPACRWFAALKQRRRSAWLSYL